MQRGGNLTAAAAAALLVLACAVFLAATPRAAQAQSSPGPTFPFYDNCRRNATFSRWSLRLLLPAVDVDERSTRFCFLVRVNESSTCPEELFTLRGKRVVSRCCNTSFAKIKFYVDPACRPQWQGSPVTVPLEASLNKTVSPTFDSRPSNYTEVKYTRFNPIPQDVLNGTTFCLTLKKSGPCNVSTLSGITSPFNRDRGVFQVAMYDRKVDDYECCPTFTFKL